MLHDVLAQTFYTFIPPFSAEISLSASLCLATFSSYSTRNVASCRRIDVTIHCLSQTLGQLLFVLSFNWRREKIVPAKVVDWRATLYLGKGQPAGKREKPWELRRSHVSWAMVQACTSQWELYCSTWPKGDDFSLMVVVSVHARLQTFLLPVAFTLLARAKGTISLACVLYR